MLCVECGKDTETTIHGSCPDCFVRATPLLAAPEVVDVEFCAHCGARRVGKQWQDRAEGGNDRWGREDAVREAVKVHQRVEDPWLQLDEEPEDAKHFRAEVALEGSVEEVAVKDRASVLVRQRRGVCDRCSRMQGDYFAAIIQLRATDRAVTASELELAHRIVAVELERQMSTGNRFSFLSKEGAIHQGWDYYVGDIEAARQVGRILKQRLGASVQETAKLVGRKEGEDVYRVTFLVRIRLFAPGDFAAVKDGRLVQVQSLQHGRAIALDLQTHLRTRVPEGSLRRLGGEELVEEAVVVSHAGSDLQLLDPVSLHTVDVPLPDAFGEVEGAAQVIRYDERLYLVPRVK